MNGFEEVATVEGQADAGGMTETQAHAAPATQERLTWEEIKARYPDEHVCLVDRDGLDLWHGTSVVYAHHRDKKTLLAMSHHLRSCGLFWTGRITNIRQWMLDRVARKV